MPEMVLHNIRTSQTGELWMMLFRARDDERYLCIWTRAAEATAIQVKLQNVILPRPMTHDLLHSVIEATGGTVSRVIVSDLVDDTFYARVVLRHGDSETEVDARPSDAIALAVRSQAPIFADETVMEKAAFEIESASGILDVITEGYGLLRQVPLFGTNVDVYVSPEQIRHFGLNAGDSLEGEVWRLREGERRFQLGRLARINGQVPAFTHDLRQLGLPLLLTTPSGWRPWPEPGPLEVNLAPGESTPGQLGITVTSKRLAGATSQQVLERVLEESEGAFELAEESDTFQLPDGFDVTALVRTVRQFANAGEPGKLLYHWLSLEGATTRWVIGQVEGNTIIVVLEALDWTQAGEVEQLLSRMRVVTP
jgi:bifunctional DNase/RNase